MKKIFSLLFAVVVGMSATTVAQGNALQQRTAMQQKKVQKERVAQAPAQISRPRKAPANTPTVEYLETTLSYQEVAEKHGMTKDSLRYKVNKYRKEQKANGEENCD